MNPGISHLLRRAVLTCTLGLIASSANAEDAVTPPDGYAVLASIGDELSLVTYQMSTGSRLDRNRHETIPLSDGRFDLAATNFAGAAIRKVLPTAPLRRVTLTDPAFFADNDELIASDVRRKALVDYVGTQLRQPLPHYLVVVTKHRADTRLKMRESSVGNGKLVGLGFYIDYDSRTTSSANGDTGRGFIAPYAYVTVSLIDLTTGAVVRSESSDESTTLATARNPNTTDPWEVLTPQQKINVLNALVKHAIDQAIPRLIAPA